MSGAVTILSEQDAGLEAKQTDLDKIQDESITPGSKLFIIKLLLEKLTGKKNKALGLVSFVGDIRFIKSRLFARAPGVYIEREGGSPRSLRFRTKLFCHSTPASNHLFQTLPGL